MIKLFKNSTELQFAQWKFPAGEVGVKLPIDVQNDKYSSYKVEMLFEGSDDVLVFLNVCDALAKMGVPIENVHAYIPYFPYARQDRACNTGESFALKVFISTLEQAK